jgi:hypothetical protein
MSHFSYCSKINNNLKSNNYFWGDIKHF